MPIDAVDPPEGCDSCTNVHLAALTKARPSKVLCRYFLAPVAASVHGPTTCVVHASIELQSFMMPAHSPADADFVHRISSAEAAEASSSARACRRQCLRRGAAMDRRCCFWC